MENESDRKSKSNTSEASGVNFLQRIGGHVQSKVLGGFMELVPLLVSAIVIWFIIGWADQFVRGRVRNPVQAGWSLLSMRWIMAT